MQSLSIKDMQAITGGRKRFFFRYLLLFVLLIFCIFQFHIYKVCGFSIYPDEFGYWASAAQALGYDWSAATALGSYYSFGYGIILTPVLWIFKDSIMAYRAALTVNMLLQCSAVGILWGIYKRLYPAEGQQERKMQIIVAVGLAVFYPPWSFYVQMTLAEALLMFLYVFLCYRLLLFIEKPNRISAVLLSLALLYIYFVHMRTAGICIAAIVTLLMYAWKEPSARKSLAAVIVLLAAGGMCGLWIKAQVMDTVYMAADASLLSVNDYTGRMETLKALLTVHGMKEFLKSSAGKLYYLIMASFGLLVPAVYSCLKKTGRLLQGYFPKQKEENMSKDDDNKNYFYFFCLLSMTGQFMITAIAMMSPGRLDGFVYGRYNEHILPVFIGIGLLSFGEMKHKLRVFTGSAVLAAMMFVITFKSALQSGLTVMQGYFAPGISYLSDDWNYDIRTEFPKGFILGLLLMAGVMFGIYAGMRFKKYLYLLGVFVLMETVLALTLGEKYTKSFNDTNYYNLKIAQYIEDYEMPVTYLYGGGFPHIDLIQFAVREREIEIVSLQDTEYLKCETAQNNRTDEDKTAEWKELESILPTEGFLVVDQDFTCLDVLEDRYQKCSESQSFVLFMVE